MRLPTPQFPSLVGRLKTLPHPFFAPPHNTQFPSLVGRLKTRRGVEGEEYGVAFPSLVGRLKTPPEPNRCLCEKIVSIPCR